VKEEIIDTEEQREKSRTKRDRDKGKKAIESVFCSLM
jgi:hypothetical protein